MKGLTRSFDLSFIEETYFFVILLTQTAEKWFQLLWVRISKMQFSLYLRGNEMAPLLNLYLAT